MNEKLGHVDSLRGVAILMVILVHASQYVAGLSYIPASMAKYGQLGVELFFVISAFTLTRSADLRGDEKDKTRRFFIRRFFRIAPLYYFGIGWYLIYSSVKESLGAGHFQLAPEYTLANVAANLLFIHGFYPPANDNVVPGGWSIGTEMAFYLIFPVLFSLYRRLSARGTNLLLAAFFVTTCVYYLVESSLLSLVGVRLKLNSYIFYSPFNHIPVFTLGILVYFLNKNRFLARIPAPVSVLLFCLLTWSTIAIWRARLVYSNSFMLVPFAAGLGFVFLYDIFAKIKMINSPILQRIGQVSYSMYLFHFLFAWDMAILMNRWLEGIIQPDILLGLYFVLTTLLAYGLANLSEKYIERPGINSGRSLIHKTGDAA
jgi:peptidoglycan/LPS O-acetylase OafA/YrhL